MAAQGKINPEELRALEPFPFPSTTLEKKSYKLESDGNVLEVTPECDEGVEVAAEEDNLKCVMWFNTGPMSLETIQRIDSVQLFTESHDANSVLTTADNRTWFDLAILEHKDDQRARVKQDVELVWTSHRNRSQTTEFGWDKGTVFDKNHPFLRLLEDGNCLAVRVCAGDQNAHNVVKNAILKLDIGDKTEREAVTYNETPRETKIMVEVFKECNSAAPSGNYMPWVSLGAFRADYYDDGHTHPLRVLAMDGGGVRGLSSLFILQKIFNKLEERLGERKKPCEIFDMIGGTSTGGLIAIMLGRLQMDVKDCIKKYQELMGIVFKKREGTLGSITDWFTKKASLLWSGQVYDDKPLETEIKKLVRSQLGDENAELLDGKGNPGCKTFVVATRRDALNNRGPVFLRSYKHPHDSRGLSNVKIWQAARATSAAPTYFSSMKVGDYELVDGGLSANNPLGWLWTEVLSIYGMGRRANCFLSIGTGIGSNQALTDPRKAPGQAISAITAAATNSEIAHLLFRTLIDAFAPNSGKPKYWRLNVNKPINKVTDGQEPEDYEKVVELDDSGAAKVLEDGAEKYIEEINADIQKCVDAILDKH